MSAILAAIASLRNGSTLLHDSLTADNKLLHTRLGWERELFRPEFQQGNFTLLRDQLRAKRGRNEEKTGATED